MMAFFLLLWLLGATTEKQRKGIADYFTPTLVEMQEQSAGSNGLLGGASVTDPDDYPHRAGADRDRSAITIPRDATGGAKEGDAQIKRMRQRLEERVASDTRLRQLMRQVRMVDTTEGTRIDLVDDADFSMFTLGTTVLTADARTLLGAIAQTVAPESGLVTIRGHTDALPWKEGVPGQQLVAFGRPRRGNAPGAVARRDRRAPLPPHRGRGGSRAADRGQPAGPAQPTDVDPADALRMTARAAKFSERLRSPGRTRSGASAATRPTWASTAHPPPSTRIR